MLEWRSPRTAPTVWLEAEGWAVGREDRGAGEAVVRAMRRKVKRGMMNFMVESLGWVGLDVGSARCVLVRWNLALHLIYIRT